MHRFFITGRDMLLIQLNPNNGKILMRSQPDYFEDIYFFYFGCCFFEYAFEVGWRVTFKVVDMLTVRPQMAGRLFQEQPHELYRKQKVYTGN